MDRRRGVFDRGRAAYGDRIQFSDASRRRHGGSTPWTSTNPSWRTAASTATRATTGGRQGDTRFAIEAAEAPARTQYEGNGFGKVTTATVGGGIYQDIALPTSAGESLCADAEVVTAATRSGARSRMVIWLYGESPGQSSSVGFGPLRGKNQWTHVSVCVTASRPHSDVRIQFYDTPKTPSLGLDAVDLR